MTSYQSRQISVFEISVAATAVMGFAYLLSTNKFQRLFNPITSWLRTKLLFQPSEIIIVNTREECADAVSKILKESRDLRFLGFDCEWVPNTTKGSQRNPVALLQLATPGGTCALFRLSKIGFIPEDVKVVLRDSTILKVGVSTQSDAHLLHQDHGALVKGCLDLRLLCQTENGLANLASRILGVTMGKHWRISCSNWAAEALSKEQILYAANDALASSLIFSKVTGLHQDLFFRMRRTKKKWHEVALHCEPFVDRTPKRHRFAGSESRNIHRHITVMQKKTNSRSFATVSRRVYDNCMLLAPDGEILATCQQSKAEWYLSNGLAEKVENLHEEASMTVQLRFEPKDRAGCGGRNYYASIKKNICVVCGCEKNHVRRSIVPREYKMFFPEKEKDHKSHDVLVLCMECNIRLDSVQSSLRRTLANKCNAPIASKQHSPFTNDQKLSKVKSAGRALAKPVEQVAKIPEDKILTLKAVVASHFGVQICELTDEHIDQASQLNSSVENTEYQSHGLLVVQHFQKFETPEGIYKLEQIWRSHFLQEMQPCYLPDGWSITHRQ